MTFAMIDGPARCMTKDMFFAETPMSLQTMATAEIIDPATETTRVCTFCLL